MPRGLTRSVWTVNPEATLVDISVDDDLTPAINIEAASFGMVYTPSTFDGTAVSFDVCDTEGGTFVPLENASSTLVSVTTAASQAFAIPDEVFGARFMKIKCASAQTTTDTQFVVTLKG